VKGSPKERGRLDARDAAFAAVVGLLVFFFYLRTLAPTVLYYSRETFDSAHLQVVGYIVGIPSYTGYPTYAMLAHLATYLPFGDPAYRVNLLSAICGSLAVGVFYLLCRKLGAGWAAAIFGALAFGLSETLWSQAVIAEVYTLHALLLSLVLLTLLLWRDALRAHDGDPARAEPVLLLAALLMGLSLTNHLTSVFLLPAALLFVLAVKPAALARRSVWAGGAILFLVGLTPYLYLPLRAAQNPPLMGENPSTLSGFVALVSGGEHKARLFVFGPAELPGRAWWYSVNLLDNLNPALLAVAVFGLVVLLVRDRAGAVLLGVVFALNLVYALEYDIEDLEIYFIPTYLILCLLAARGAASLLEMGANTGRRIVRYGALGAVAVAVLATALVVPTTWREVDRSGDFKGRQMIDAVAWHAKPNATILHHGRTLDYMQLVEGKRRDVRLVDPFYGGRWVEEADKALRRGPTYVMNPGATNIGKYRRAGYRLTVVGRPAGTGEEVVRLYEISGPR
jgi:hypothetical protein